MPTVLLQPIKAALRSRSKPTKRALHSGEGASIGEVFSFLSLLVGEDQASYDRLAAQITAAVSPQDLIELIGVRDALGLVHVKRAERDDAGE